MEDWRKRLFAGNGLEEFMEREKEVWVGNGEDEKRF